jgi:hypothetical protein
VVLGAMTHLVTLMSPHDSLQAGVYARLYGLCGRNGLLVTGCGRYCVVAGCRPDGARAGWPESGWRHPGLGLPLGPLRVALVTCGVVGTAVAQTGLIAFVGWQRRGQCVRSSKQRMAASCSLLVAWWAAPCDGGRHHGALADCPRNCPWACSRPVLVVATCCG